jgi:hypothetical protein
MPTIYFIIGSMAALDDQNASRNAAKNDIKIIPYSKTTLCLAA